MGWDQWLILITGPAAIGLSQIGGKWARWACIVGLCGQFGWFTATFKAAQWGMFLASFVYAGMWMIGFYRHWLKSFLDGLEASTATPTAAPGTGKPPSARHTKPRLRLVTRRVTRE